MRRGSKNVVFDISEFQRALQGVNRAGGKDLIQGEITESEPSRQYQLRGG